MMLAIKKVFDLLGDDIVDLSTKNDSLKNIIGTYHEKRLEESERKLLKQFIDKKRANLIESRKEKQMQNNIESLI